MEYSINRPLSHFTLADCSLLRDFTQCIGSA